MVSSIEGQIEASNIQDRVKEQINEVLENVKQLFQNEIIQEITETAFNKHQLQVATEQLSKHELRIHELEEELSKQKETQYGNGGLFSSMIASPDYQFDAEKNTYGNNIIEQDHSDDEVIEKVYSSN